MKKCLIVSTVSRQFTLFERGNIETLKELGYEVHCAANYSDRTEELKKLEIIEHNINIQRSPFSIKNIRAYIQLRRIIKSDKYDLIHCHSPMGGVLTRIAARKTRKTNHTRVLYTAHGFHFFKGAPFINWLLYYPIEKWLSKYTDCIFTINEEDYDIASKKFKSDKVELVNGIGVDNTKFEIDLSEKKHEIRKSLGLNDNDFVLIQVGELNKNKNQIMALNAMKSLVEENSNIHLLLVGKGSLEGYYKKTIEQYGLKNNVHMLGYRNDIPKLMKISDTLLSLSYREGLPVNVMEGIMSGLPIIATNCRGNNDLVKNEENGYIINLNDIKELEKGILNLYNNKIEIKKFSMEKYFKENIKKHMKEVYCSLARKRVLHLLSTTTFSGAENVVCQIIKMFNKSNFEMVYCSPKGNIEEKLEIEKIKYAGINKLNYICVRKILKQYKPDIIHAHDIRASIIAAMFSKNIKIISHIHGNHDNMKKKTIKSILYCLFKNGYSKIFWVSKSAMQEYYFKEKVKNKSEVLMNVIDKNQIYAKVQEDKEEYSYDIIYLGRLAKEKNPLRVYEIMKDVVKSNDKVKCAFVGDGELKEKLKEHIKSDALESNIVLKGNMDNPMKILKSAKILVMASKYEGTPMCALEAMSLGVPIVATPTDGLVELVKNGVNGFLSEENENLVVEIDKIIKNEEYRKKLSKNNIKIFNEQNDIDQYMKKIEREYNK